MMINPNDDLQEGEDELSAFFNDNSDDDSSEEDAFLNEDDLFSFLDEKEDDTTEEDAFLNEDDLFSFLDNGEEEDENTTEEEGGFLGGIFGSETAKPTPVLAQKEDKRKAKLDITKNSKEDQRTIVRYTKKELNDQLIRDYRYMLGKSYMVIQPVTIMAEYPYKKKKSNSDIIKERNVEEDYVMVIGRLLKWRSTEEFRGKPYKLGSIMYIRKGEYWVDGETKEMKPHFAIVIHKSYKHIKSKRIRDLLDPLKQKLRTGKPFSIYKEFPIIVKRTGMYS